MKIEIETVKGFQDFLPPESLKREAIKRIIEKWYRLYGFVPIETPVVEFDELMKGESMDEDEAVSDRFRLKDRAGRNLGLRYEFTFQLSRIIKQNPNMKLPFRRYQVGNVFRDEPTGPGRFRQFTQCDADIIGEENIDADIDCVSLIADILKDLGIEAEVYVNNRKLIYAIIESVEIQQKDKVMKELDKLNKIGEDNVKANLKKYADANQIITLFKLLQKPLDFFIENAFDGAKELDKLIDKGGKNGVKIIFSPFMIRGLGYYTGNIFEVRVGEGGTSIAAGGRYDKVVGKYLGRDVPAVGMSFGLERITELADIEVPKTPVVQIISIGQDSECNKLIRKLRKEGISCIINNDKVGKALEYANATDIPYVLLVGSDEIAKKKYKLKNMKSGTEEMLTDKQLIKKLT